MPKEKDHDEAVRPSRDGHEYHEAWVARQSLRLVLPQDGIVGISMEGLSVEDQKNASKETVEIADLAIYYGPAAKFEKATNVCITQAKYSVRKASEPFKAVDAAKTIKKFGETFRSQRRLHGIRAVRSKLQFAIVTNRPIAAEFDAAIKGIALGQKLKGKVTRQAKQFKKASALKGKDLQEFTHKFNVVSSTGNLQEIKNFAARLVNDWSAGEDAMARLRLGELRNMVRNKAGSEGTGNNLIRRTDVFAALGLQSEKDLLPFPLQFPAVGPVVPREQLADTLKVIPKLVKPLLIHAEGGIGKTVFMESLIKTLSTDHLCICFDCFDGGAYRVMRPYVAGK